MEEDNPGYVMGGGLQLSLQERLARARDAFTSAPAFDRAVMVEVQSNQYPVSVDDVSTWQGNIDFTKMRQQAQAVYVRAGYGNDGIDARYEANVSGAQSAMMPWGLYWYVKVGKDFKKHVNSFKAVYQAHGGKLTPVFDCEYTEMTSKFDTGNWLAKLVKSWRDATGIEPAIYTRASWWDSHTYRQDWPKLLDLWIAQYTTAAQPNIPADWGAVANPRDWTFWQYSADGNGLGSLHGVQSASIDRNRFNGTIAQFNSKYGTNIQALGTGVVTPPVTPPVASTHVVTTQVCNPRTRPSLSNNADAGSLIKGATFEKAGPMVGEFQPVKMWLHKSVMEDV